MRRAIITIDEEKCDGCGDCIGACHEGALKLVDGKARLASDAYCDGLGACLGECPRGAITVVEREAPAFDEAAVNRHLAASAPRPHPAHPAPLGGCPGSAHRAMRPAAPASASGPTPSQLSHWPVQLSLVSPAAPFLAGRDLLVCADCVPFAMADFHARFLAGKAVLVGCPKLDDLELYAEKLKAILAHARPRSLTVARMEVPCCGGIAQAALAARDEVLPDLPAEVHVVAIDGSVAAEPRAAAGGYR